MIPNRSRRMHSPPSAANRSLPRARARGEPRMGMRKANENENCERSESRTSPRTSTKSSIGNEAIELRFLPSPRADFAGCLEGDECSGRSRGSRVALRSALQFLSRKLTPVLSPCSRRG